MDVRAPACLCIHIMHRHACEKRSEEKRGEEMRREEKTQEPRRDAGDPPGGDRREDWMSDGGEHLGAQAQWGGRQPWALEHG